MNLSTQKEITQLNTIVTTANANLSSQIHTGLDNHFIQLSTLHTAQTTALGQKLGSLIEPMGQLQETIGALTSKSMDDAINKPSEMEKLQSDIESLKSIMAQLVHDRAEGFQPYCLGVQDGNQIDSQVLKGEEKLSEVPELVNRIEDVLERLYSLDAEGDRSLFLEDAESIVTDIQQLVDIMCQSRRVAATQDWRGKRKRFDLMDASKDDLDEYTIKRIKSIFDVCQSVGIGREGERP